MLKSLWLKIRQSRIGQGVGTIGTQVRQISSRQWAVTVGSAVIMLVGLTVFWNHFILPGHLPDSYDKNSKEVLQAQPRETTKEASTEVSTEASKESSAGDKSSQVDSKEALKGNPSAPVGTGDNSAHTGASEATSTQTKTASNDSLRSPSANPDLSLAKNPVAGELIKEFGFVFFPTLKEYRFHGAIDVAAAKGTSVKCIFAGVVESIQSSAEEGNSVTVNHGGGLKSVYRHLGKVAVQKDTNVEAGTELGTLGQPGSLETVEGVHLHFELIRDGEQIDPLEYLSY